MSKRGKSNKGRITPKRVQATENLPPPVIPHVEVRPEKDEDAWDVEGLTVRNRLFVEAIIGPAAGDASRAAEIAGYRCDNANSLAATASEILRRPKVREAIARRISGANLTPEWVRQMTAALAASNMGNFIALDAKGEPELNWREAEKLGAFVQIRKYKEKSFKVGEMVDVVERTIETHNPAPYLQMLSRMLGIANDPQPAAVNVNVQVDVTTLTDQELEVLARAYDRLSPAIAPARNPAPGEN